jgi:hypothetical protein
VKDYLKMRKINRKNLTKFLKRIQRNRKQENVNGISFDSQSTDKDYFKEEEEEEEKKTVPL